MLDEKEKERRLDLRKRMKVMQDAALKEGLNKLKETGMDKKLEGATLVKAEWNFEGCPIQVKMYFKLPNEEDLFLMTISAIGFDVGPYFEEGEEK